MKFVRPTLAIAAVLTAALALAQSSGPQSMQPGGHPPPDVAPTGNVDKVSAASGMTATPEWVRPETPEQRRERLGTAEDPGPDPDPAKHYWRYGKSYHIEKFPRRWAAYDQPLGFVRPVAMANVPFELYQHNKDFVWCWIPDPEPDTKPVPESGATMDATAPIAGERNANAMAFLKRIRPQWELLDPPASSKTIHFRESSLGLPTSGSWRNSVAVADMNGDGFLDIVTTPQRGITSNNLPTIFLGDGKGHWKSWDKAKFPHGMNYGSVVAADFNKDGHMDLAFAVHLTGIQVYLGDGAGNFRQIFDGVPRDFGSRRLRVADLNNDGWPDLVAVTEGASTRSVPNSLGPVIAIINRKKGTAFEVQPVIDVGKKTGGDYLSVGDLNGDGIPDMVIGSNVENTWDVVYLSDGPLKWADFAKNDGDIIPSMSFYFGSAIGKFSSKSKNDAIITYDRFWPHDIDANVIPPPKNMSVSDIDRISVNRDGSITRTPIMRIPGQQTNGVATGDFDGDGNLDVIVITRAPREAVILLGDGKGHFERAKIEGLPIEALNSYDVAVADVNGDGRPDVIIEYEAEESRNALRALRGGVHVFLNEGVGEPAAAKKK